MAFLYFFNAVMLLVVIPVLIFMNFHYKRKAKESALMHGPEHKLTLYYEDKRNTYQIAMWTAIIIRTII